MAGQGSFIDDAEQRARWEGFQWTPENARKAKEFIGFYPEGRQVSAVIPLLDLAQRQVGADTKTQGWLPIPVMEFVARELDTSYIRVLEVATFYTMFNLAPVGRFHVQVCGWKSKLPAQTITVHDPSSQGIGPAQHLAGAVQVARLDGVSNARAANGIAIQRDCGQAVDREA